MTPFQAIYGIVSEMFPEATISTGFGAELTDFLERERVAGTCAFISVGLCSPKRSTEGGRRTGYVDSFTVYLRGRSNPADPDASYYTLFAPLRNALDGHEFTMNDELYTLQFEPSGPLYEQGFDTFALNVSVS